MRSSDGPRRARPWIALVLGLAFSSPIGAQGGAPPIADASLRRARALAASGDLAAARAIADSVAATGDAGRKAEALYWSATWSEAPATARTKFIRVAVEHALTPIAAWAQLRIAEQDVELGDRAGAQRRLERLVRDFDSGASAYGGLLLARLQREQGRTLEACTTLDSSRVRAPPDAVELVNQLAYAARTCELMASRAQRAAADSAPAITNQPGNADTSRQSANADSASTTTRATARGATGASPTRPARAWSVQVAAFATLAEARRLASRISERGHDARVTTDRPFRVRIGRFATRADAVALAGKLKAEGNQAIIVEAERP